MKFIKGLVVAYAIGASALAVAQEEKITAPAAGQTVATVLADIQGKVDKIQTLKADLEFDRKDKDDKKNKKKKKDKKDKGATGINPEWPEPLGRDVERGPLEISRGAGARAVLERKTSKEMFVANSSVLWKYDVDDKEARKIPANWPVIDKYVSNALKMNVFVAMDEDTLKLRGTEVVDGVDCWVLDGKSPSSLGTLGVESTKMKVWIGKQDGIPRVIRVPSEKDTIIRLKNVKLNQPVDASQFNLTPPADVEVKNIFGF